MKNKPVSCDVYVFREKENRQEGFLGKKPVYKTSGAAAADVRLPFIVTVPAHETCKVPLRIGFDIPAGYCIMMYPRSSLLVNKGLMSPVSVIDHDYSRHEVHFVAVNVTDKDVRLEAGERVAQVMLTPYVDVPEWEHENAPRVPGGFGGTGEA